MRDGNVFFLTDVTTLPSLTADLRVYLHASPVLSGQGELLLLLFPPVIGFSLSLLQVT